MTHSSGYRSPGQTPLPYRVSNVPGDMIRTLKYGVVYKIPTVHRMPRLIIGVYSVLAPRNDREDLVFHGQDQFGTVYLNPAWIKEVWQVEAEIKCLNRNLTRHDLKDDAWRKYIGKRG